MRRCGDAAMRRCGDAAMRCCHKAVPEDQNLLIDKIDAAIDVPWTRKVLPDHPDDFFANPADIVSSAFISHINPEPPGHSMSSFDLLGKTGSAGSVGGRDKKNCNLTVAAC
jgi:hypothetical protein